MSLPPVPRERFAQLLLDHARVHAGADVWERGSVTQIGLLGWLANETGLNPRLVSKYLHGHTDLRHRHSNTHVSFDTVDRVLCRLGLNYLWHVPAERGGLADLYEVAA